MKPLLPNDEANYRQAPPWPAQPHREQAIMASENNSSGKLTAWYAALTRDEQPQSMLILLSLLTTALHALLIQELFSHKDLLISPPPPKPIVVEMVLKPATAPKQAEKLIKPVSPPKVQMPKPAITKPKPQKIITEKPKPKPVIKKEATLPEKIMPRSEPISKQPESNPIVPQQATPHKDEVPRQAAAPKVAETYSEATFHANYAYNPKPVYPSIARKQHWTGRVLLRVQVGIDGNCEAVSIEQSSGHDVLDEAALKAVKQWMFTPAKRGNTPVRGSVKVPISFNSPN